MKAKSLVPLTLVVGYIVVDMSQGLRLFAAFGFVFGLVSRVSGAEELSRRSCNVFEGECWSDLVARLQSSSLDKCELGKVR